MSNVLLYVPTVGPMSDVLRARNATIWDTNACAKSYGYNATADHFENMLCVKGIEHNATVCAVSIKLFCTNPTRKIAPPHLLWHF